MKLAKKIQKRLERRLRGHEIACKLVEKRSSGSSKGFRAPGSRNPRKT